MARFASRPGLLQRAWSAGGTLLFCESMEIQTVIASGLTGAAFTGHLRKVAEALCWPWMKRTGRCWWSAAMARGAMTLRDWCLVGSRETRKRYPLGLNGVWSTRFSAGWPGASKSIPHTRNEVIKQTADPMVVVLTPAEDDRPAALR